MGKRVFMFPGQGSQYIGMGKDFYESFPAAKEIFELAGEAAKLDVAKLCFEEEDKINQTEYTQIAMLTTEAAILKVLQQEGVSADAAAGLSLGEYAAILAAEVMEPKDVFALIRKRGQYMQNAVPTGGAMAAVLGLDAAIIEKVCEDTFGDVFVANYNCPGQIVITGEQSAVDRASESLKEAGAKRIVPLKVSGPFHSPLLQEAGQKLAVALEKVKIFEPKIGYLSNVTADYVTDPEKIRSLLPLQVCHSVCWQQTVERLIADGADEFVEIGPGKTLSGFLRKINREIKCSNIDKVEDLKKYVG
ncbi:MAG: ACP S-malonyltransferase [Eubacterium sp.]|nr:ACP S-malonyltransferase [Eubacterium sp.]